MYIFSRCYLKVKEHFATITHIAETYLLAQVDQIPLSQLLVLQSLSRATGLQFGNNIGIPLLRYIKKIRYSRYNVPTFKGLYYLIKPNVKSVAGQVLQSRG